MSGRTYVETYVYTSDNALIEFWVPPVLVPLLFFITFYKKGVLRNFTKFTGKHVCQSLFFLVKLGLRPATFIKKETLVYWWVPNSEDACLQKFSRVT